MFTRLITAAALTFCFTAAASANCGPCNPVGYNSGAYSAETQRGVTVMRGNIPNIRNPQNTLIAQRKEAQQRADTALRRAQRDAANSRAQLAARPTHHYDNAFRVEREYRSNSGGYNSGRYGYGASISRARFGGRRGSGHSGYRGRGGKGISRPAFTTRIRG